MRIAVAMSGGVDSSVSALILKEKGYEVIGVTLRFHSEECRSGLSHNVCCSPQDVRDAAFVSQQLGIPHITLSWEEIFRERVIKYFVDEYLSGRTPNPCAVCNREVKTAFLADYLKKVADIDRLATGHHAIIGEHPQYGKVIRRGKDQKKDQSYFLSLIPQKSFENLEFPIGSMTKEEIRTIARKRGLRVAEKRDSQEVCFLMGMTPGEFIERLRGEKKGDIVTKDGAVLGTHRGIFNFTIGQRRGLGISAGKPLYVLDLDPEGNRVIVGEEEFLYSEGLRVKAINFHVPPERWNRTFAQIRYRSRPVGVKDIVREGDGYRIIFEERVRGITPGQVIAFYDGDVLLGGSIIEERL